MKTMFYCLESRFLVATVLLITTAVAVRGDSAVNLQQATVLSRQSGKPLFAIYGTRSCPHCVALMSRLKSDQSLRDYGNAFVILKVDQDDPMRPQFNQRLSPDVNSVPRLYFVNAKGKALKIQVGAPRGEGLTRLFDSVLQQSGPAISIAAIRKLQTLSDEDALSSLPLWGQSERWKQVSAILVNGNRWSSELLPIAERHDRYVSEVNARATIVGTTIQASPTDLNAILEAAALNLIQQRQSDTAPSAKDATNVAAQALQKAGVERTTARESATVAANLLDAMSIERRLARPAKMRLDSVLRSAPSPAESSTQSSALRSMMQAVNLPLPQPTVPSQPSSGGAMMSRTWTSADGKFQRQGKLLRRNSTHIEIELTDGAKTPVPIASLSDEDKQFLMQTSGSLIE